MFGPSAHKMLMCGCLHTNYYTQGKEERKMTTYLNVPVRVDVYTKGEGSTHLGKGWIKGIRDTRVAWLGGVVIACAREADFTAEEEKQLTDQGAHLGSIPSTPIVVLDDGRVFPVIWVDTEYIFDEANK